jgi:Xaa-Pro aminopeptidase
MSERKVASIFAEAMIEEGGEKPFFMMVNSQTNAEINLHPHDDRKLKKGDVLWVDGGSVYRDYTCDYSRIATVGKPSRRQVELHQAVVEISRKMMEQIKPEIRINELFFIYEDELKRLKSKGLLKSKQRSCKQGTEDKQLLYAACNGHGQGMDITEFPLVAAHDETSLKPGMTFSIEPVISEDGFFVWEDVIAVTRNGYDLLSTETPELIQI